MSEPVLRGIERDELQDWFTAMGLTFGFDPDPAHVEEIAEYYDVSRARVAEVDGRFVATFSAFDLEVTVPGASLPMSGVTQVTVAATHRRSGILRSLMESHLDEVTERGWPLAGLWASEGTIYGRFGFGPATWHHDVEISRPDPAMILRAATSRLTLITKDEALAVLPPIHAAVVAERPGMYQRTQQWWQRRALRDRPEFRDGYSAHRIVVAGDAGEPDGYAIYRLKGDLDMTLHVSEVVATSPQVEAELWRYLLGVDLVGTIRAPRRPVDDTLPWQFTDLRSGQLTVGDALWLRILDVPATLSARRYASAGVIVLEVVDGRSGGRYLLDVGPDGSSCTATDREPDVTMTVADLGSLYLGGASAHVLARSGRIQGSTEAVTTLHTLMAWPIAPWCPEIF